MPLPLPSIRLSARDRLSRTSLWIVSSALRAWKVSRSRSSSTNVLLETRTDVSAELIPLVHARMRLNFYTCAVSLTRPFLRHSRTSARRRSAPPRLQHPALPQSLRELRIRLSEHRVQRDLDAQRFVLGQTQGMLGCPGGDRMEGRLASDAPRGGEGLRGTRGDRRGRAGRRRRRRDRMLRVGNAKERSRSDRGRSSVRLDREPGDTGKIGVSAH